MRKGLLGTWSGLATIVCVGAISAAACGSTEDKPAEVPEAGPGSITPDATSPGSETGTVTPLEDGAVPVDGTAPPADVVVPTGDPDGGTSSDAGPGGTTTALTCGTATCVIPGNVCCVYDNQGSPTFTFTCVAGTTCPDVPDTGNDVPALGCSGPSNCGATDVCCITRDGNDAFVSACKPAAQCADDGDVEAAILCDPAQPTVGCEAGDECSSNNIDDWNLPNGYGTCGGIGT